MFNGNYRDNTYQLSMGRYLWKIEQEASEFSCGCVYFYCSTRCFFQGSCDIRQWNQLIKIVNAGLICRIVRT